MKDAIVLDVDTGSDDALAIMYAIKSDIIPDIVVTSYGNTDIDNATKNTIGVLNIANSKTMVLKGSAFPIKVNDVNSSLKGWKYHGKNGLYGIKLNYKYPAGNVSDLFLNTKILFPSNKNITWIITGPCTNLARLITLSPDFKNRISKVIIMGGSLNEDNSETKSAEFNFMNDAEAVDILLKSGMNLYIVPLESAKDTYVKNTSVDNIKSFSNIGDLSKDIFHEYFDLPNSKNIFHLYDPLVIGAQKGLVKFQTKKIVISVKNNNYGSISEDQYGYNVKYANEVSSKEFLEDFLLNIDLKLIDKNI